jgi:hypothetical protein
MYITLKRSTIVAITNAIRISISKAAYIINERQHITKMRKVRADYIEWRSCVSVAQLKILYKLLERFAFFHTLFGDKFIVIGI